MSTTDGGPDAGGARDAAQSETTANGPSAEPRDRDHALVRRAQTGDEAAFAELVGHYERRAWRVARNMVPGDEDARDLVQEAFLRVFRNLDRFDFQHAFSTWLYRIVSNLAIDHLRRRRRTTSTSAVDDDDAPLDLVDESVPAPSAALESFETQGEVRACLETLAPHFQSVLVLRELEGLPCTEIAEIVGATHVTVRWRLHRGRKLFQEEWERRARLREGTRGAPANEGSASYDVNAGRDSDHPDDTDHSALGAETTED